MQPKKDNTSEKSNLHPRSKHRERYDFEKLIACCSELKPFVHKNIYGDESIDFFDPKAVKTLNKSLLLHFYNLHYWDIPEPYLCPPVPGRADYIHYMADVLANVNQNQIPNGNKVTCLDIGVGANMIYPIVGLSEYDWNFIGSDIDHKALDAARSIISQHIYMSNKIDLRFQPQAQHIFKNIIHQKEYIDITICNPPFHASMADAQAGTRRKLNNLTGKKNNKTILNFGGQANELWCKGGELAFIKTMIEESKLFAKQVLWFSSLVSKQSHLKSILYILKTIGVSEYKTIEMAQGNKVSRIVVWTYLTKAEQQDWAKTRWK